MMYFLKRFKLIIMKKISWTYIRFLYSTIGIVTYFFFVAIAFGQIKVVDADTIIFNKEKIRLYGIDAPETAQYYYMKKRKLGHAEN